MAEDRLPPATVPDSVHNWIREAVQESEAFLKEQPGYAKIDETMRAVLGAPVALKSSKLSDTESNHLGKVASDMAALLTDVKPFWEFRTLNKRFEKQAEIQGKLATHWYLSRFIDIRLNMVIKYWEMAGTGWPHIVWDGQTQDIAVTAEDPRDVLPVRPSSDYMSAQDAEGMVLRRERTVNHLRARYPERLWHLIKADRDGSMRGSTPSSTRFTRLVESMGGAADGPFMQRLFGGPARRTPRIPMADVYTVYLKDDRRNDTTHPVLIGSFDADGEALDNWSYVVPPKGKLYPRGRCIIATSRGVLHDGPNPFWHGMFPLPKLTLDPWPQTWLGKAPLWDLLKLQRSLDGMLRIVDDHMGKIARPDIIADKGSVSRAALEKYDTRRPGGKYMHNPLAGKGMQIVDPGRLPSEVQWYIEFLINEMDTLSGVRDISQLMRLNQVPGADTIEKITESMTASVRGRSRALEAFMREFGTMMAFNFAQFYTLPMKLRILGEDGLTMEDFDYDPGTFIPDFVHDDDFDERGIPTEKAMTRGPLPRYDRAREFMRQFEFHIAPGSLLAASEIQRKLIYLQLARAGLIDHWTLLEVMGIPNVGEPPSGAGNITSRLMAEQEMGLGMAISATGRKATGQTMPRMKVSES